MIKSIIIWICIFVAAVVLQTSLVPSFAIMGVKPDLLILLLFFLAIKTGMMPAIFIGFFIGLAQDIYSPSILGQCALAKTIAGFFAGIFNEKVMRLDPLFLGVLLILSFFVNDITVYVVQFAKTGSSFTSIAQELLRSTLFRALYTLLFAVVPILWEQHYTAKIRR